MTLVLSEIILSTPEYHDHSPIEESFHLLNLEKSLPGNNSSDINNIEQHNILDSPSLSPTISDTTILMQKTDSPFDSDYSNANHRSPYEFMNILSEANLSNFLSFYYLTSNDSLAIDITATSPASYLPNEYETIAHLKLFKAFALLKKRILSNSKSGTNSNLVWKGFITNAVRRFIIFVSALKKFMERFNSNTNYNNVLRTNKDPAFLSVMSQILPPLDVLLVWHSFLVNPSSFYDVFVRSNMLQFANFAFPLHKVCQYIDNFDFEFRVPFEYKHNYLEVIKCFVPSEALSDDYLQYEINEFNCNDKYVTVYCPNCKHVLSDPIPLSNGNRGFADQGLRSKNIRLVQDSSCYCSWIFLITHSELRKLQLYADIKRLGILQGTFRIRPSEVIVKDPIKSGTKFISIFDKIWEENRFKNLDFIVHRLQEECDKELLPQGKLLRNYSKFNLVSMTVPEGIELGEDLVECVLKQERFNNKMNNLNWIHSPNINQILSEASSRYAKFFTILSNPSLNNNCLKPTLDIELMWKTHNLSGFGYFRDCLSSSCHYIIDDDDQGTNSLLNNDIDKTAEVYKSIYKEDYLICYCQICTIERAISSVGSSDDLIQLQPPPLQPQNDDDHHQHRQHLQHDEFTSPFLKPPPPIMHSNSFDDHMFSKNSEYSWDIDDQYSSTSAPAGILTDESLLDESELANAIGYGVGTDGDLLDYFSYPGENKEQSSTFSVSPNEDDLIGILQ